MKVYSQAQANEVAERNAMNMTDDLYTVFEPIAEEPTVWHTGKNDESGITYRQVITENGCTCNCAFFLQNARYGTCKHIENIRTRQMVAAMEAEQEARAEWENMAGAGRY